MQDTHCALDLNGWEPALQVVVVDRNAQQLQTELRHKVRIANKQLLSDSTPEVFFSGALHGDERHDCSFCRDSLHHSGAQDTPKLSNLSELEDWSGDCL